ncbi:MAG: VOC family protein [Pseudomonadales bacterium]|jgi:catechol-2,3-dioxygenase
MQLKWSHAVIYVKDLEKMLAFYTGTLGFSITDRGALGSKEEPQIIFLSQHPDEHHQIAMITTRQEIKPSNSVNHFAFRVDEFEDVTDLNQQLDGIDGIKIMPLSHGNTLSIYFNDPEGNGIEVFWDTPWHIAQPQGKPWDASLDKEKALDWVKDNFGEDATFVPREDYYAGRHDSILSS